MIEIYNNPADQVPDYEKMHPLLLHLAFVSENSIGDWHRLQKAGAVFVKEVKPGADHLVMMRAPWSLLAIQLCKRGIPMI